MGEVRRRRVRIILCMGWDYRVEGEGVNGERG